MVLECRPAGVAVTAEGGPGVEHLFGKLMIGLSEGPPAAVERAEHVPELCGMEGAGPRSGMRLISRQLAKELVFVHRESQ